MSTVSLAISFNSFIFSSLDILLDNDIQEEIIKEKLLTKLNDLAANYSTIYDVWCKDMINKRVKMRMMADKKKAMKKGKAKDN